MSFIFPFGRHTVRPFSIALAFGIGVSACGNDAGGSSTATGAPAAAGSDCVVAGALTLLPGDLSEASGAAVSRARPELIWTHNDSGTHPELFAIDTLGAIVTRAVIDIPGEAAARDWEDIAIGDCGDGHCLYIADIGDNAAARPAARILRVREADALAGSGTAESFLFRYPEGPLDAEAIFVLPGERLFVVTKGRSRAVALYRYPGALRRDTVTLEHVQDLTPGLVQLPDQVTGATASADGGRVILRTYSYLRRFTVARDGSLEESRSRIDLTGAGESQGEGVGMGSDGALYLLGEKGFDRESGTFGRVVCH